MIHIKDISKSYNNQVVLSIPELEIKSGTVIGLVGNNGAGKTTLIRCMLDLIQPNSGGIESFEVPVAKSETWKTFTGAFVDEGFLIDFLTPLEYFKVVAKLRHINLADFESQLETFKEFFNHEILDSSKYIRDLSKGNQKKVGIAAAMLGYPKVLILDEPFANLDPTTVYRLKQLLKEYKSVDENIQLISSHDLQHVAEISDRICILNKGELVKDSPANENTLKELEEYFAVQ